MRESCQRSPIGLLRDHVDELYGRATCTLENPLVPLLPEAPGHQYDERVKTPAQHRWQKQAVLEPPVEVSDARLWHKPVEAERQQCLEPYLPCKDTLACKVPRSLRLLVAEAACIIIL